MTKNPAAMLKVLCPALALAVHAAGAAAPAPPPATPQAQAPPAINPDLLGRRWDARWIAAPGTDPFGFGVYHFRKTLDLPERPQRFVVHVTADNRYQLWVNGERVLWGPARGDLNHWRFETLDLAPHLRAGRNVLAAVVWNSRTRVAEVSERGVSATARVDADDLRRVDRALPSREQPRRTG